MAVKIDCADCDHTGYSNFWTTINLRGFYTPGAVKRWNVETGAISFLGECSLKFDAKWADVLTHTDYFYFNGSNWNFALIEDPGASMGQARLICALNRQ